MTAVVVGIDSSTQSCTVVLRDLDTGETVAVQSSRHPRTTPPVSEQDPASWWTALGQSLTQARKAVPGASVATLSVDAQAHGLVPVDAAGTVIRPAKLWNDTTSSAEARVLVDRLGRHEWVRRTGSVPPAAFTISKVLWLARHEPEHFDRLRHLLLPHDWLTYQLTGEYLTDPSDASGTGYYNPATGEWDTSLLGLVDPGIDWAARLPRLLAHDEPAGPLTRAAAASLGLHVGTLVGPGAADNQAAAVGMGVRAGDVVVSLGTSGVVYTRSELAVHDTSGAVNGNADATGHFLPVVCTLNAAKVTDTFTRLLGVDHDQLSQLAVQAPVTDPDRPMLAAFLDGERVPDRPDASGTLTGLRSDTTREQVARAAYEGVLAGLVRGLGTLTDLGVPTTGRLVVTGGGARSAAYRQLLADLTGRPVHVVDQHETAAAGAALQAAAVYQQTNIDELADAWSPAWRVVAEPRPGADPDQLMARYRSLADWSALEPLQPHHTHLTLKGEMMRAVIYEQPGSMQVGEAPDPTPAPGEVVIRVGAVGICGSDLNIAAGLFPPTPFPIIPGHEFAGEVVAVASDVDFVHEGDRVAVDPSLFCGHCKWCRVGRGNLCDSWGAIGDTVNGGAAEYVAVPAVNCHHIPASMSYSQAAVIEPLSCAVHAVAVAPPRIGESVLVVGGGTMGLLTGQLLLARGGASQLALVERKLDRLPIGERVGFGPTFTGVDEALAERPEGYDLVVDATGVPAAIEAAFGAVAKGGRFLQVGVAPPEKLVPISPYRIYYEEITVLGSMAVLDSYAPALRLIADGLVQVEPLLTHQLPLSAYPDAFEALRRGDGLKIQLLP